MAPIEKKWNDLSERDLLLAMVCANSTGNSIKVNWGTVHGTMTAMGYDFTESAISQKFGKGIIKDFKTKYGPDCISRFSSGVVGTLGAVSDGVSTPRKPRAPKGSGSASASKRKNSTGFTPVNSPAQGRDEGDDVAGPAQDDTFVEDDADQSTPIKKLKLEEDSGPQSPLKHSNNEPVSYEAWLDEAKL